MWLGRVDFGCTEPSLASTSKPIVPFPYTSGFCESLCTNCFFAALPLFAVDSHVTLAQWPSGRHSCISMVSALCQYEFKAHTKYERSLSTQINQQTPLLHPMLQRKEKNLEKRGFLWMHGIGCVWSTLNYCCSLATKNDKIEQETLLHYSSGY